MIKLFDYQQNLVDEARIKFAQGKKAVLIVSPAGSGKSVIIANIAKLATDKHNQIMFMVHRKELVEQITNTFNKVGVNLHYATIMTVGKIVHRLNTLPKPTLIITDETHHSLAKQYQKIYSFYKTALRLGFTATPWRLSGKGLHDIYDDMIEGPSVQQLIDDHHLAPENVYGFDSGNAKLLKRSSTGDFTKKSLKEFDQSIIMGDIIENWLKYAKNRKTIIYCNSIEFSKKVVAEFNNNDITAMHVDSNTPKSNRENIMNDFRTGKITILSNVDLISEGFDVPDCSCVVLLRPTKSLVLYIQQAMRCMRYQPNKRAVIIDQVANFKRFGLPEDPRKWTLDDRQKYIKKVEIKTCPNCFAVFNPLKMKHGECPYCGFQINEIIENSGGGRSELEVDKTIKLHLIKQAPILKKDINELDSYSELLDYAKAKGYKEGWAYYQAKNRGWI